MKSISFNIEIGMKIEWINLTKFKVSYLDIYSYKVNDRHDKIVVT